MYKWLSAHCCADFMGVLTLAKVYAVQPLTDALNIRDGVCSLQFSDGTRNKCISNKCIAVRKVATPLRELTCHMGSHSVTCHPAEVTFPPLPQPKLVLD